MDGGVNWRGLEHLVIANKGQIEFTPRAVLMREPVPLGGGIGWICFQGHFCSQGAQVEGSIDSHVRGIIGHPEPIANPRDWRDVDYSAS